jgi:serine/threonine-protein kinase 31
MIECLNKSPSVEHLLSIKKTLKGLKAQLRWKLVEKNNLEEVRKQLPPSIFASVYFSDRVLSFLPWLASEILLPQEAS